ncbi:MAG TPA: hypothetical protein VJU82_15920 [Acidobacteriaceae bacterium]|nr:hypothetical protein [Acidobacteriaceae bacterium]
MNVRYNSQFAHEDHLNESDIRLFPQVAASATVVNRTHRVVRQRAQVLKARRSRVRSLMVPLVLCSALLILTIAAVWTGLYEYQGAADALQDVSSTIAAATDKPMDNEFLVTLFWFVPVTLAMLGTVWVTRSRAGTTREIGR